MIIITDLNLKRYEIIGVSADSEKAQKNFSDKFSFDYSLLCDETKK